MTHKGQFILLIVIIVCVLLLVGWWYWSVSGPGGKNKFLIIQLTCNIKPTHNELVIALDRPPPSGPCLQIKSLTVSPPFVSSVPWSLADTLHGIHLLSALKNQNIIKKDFNANTVTIGVTIDASWPEGTLYTLPHGPVVTWTLRPVKGADSFGQVILSSSTGCGS